MKCWNCGAELREGQQFCGGCGAQQNTQTPPPQPGPQMPPPPAGDAYTGAPYTAPAGGGQNNGPLLIKIIAIAFAVIDVIFALACIGSIFSGLGTIFNIMRYHGPFLLVITTLLTIILSLLNAVADIAMGAGLLLIAFKQTPENADGLLLCTGAAAAARVLLTVISIPVVFLAAIAGNSFAAAIGTVVGSIGGLLLCLIGVALPLAGIYAVRRYMMNEAPLAGKSKDQMIAEMKAALASVRGAASEVGAAAAAGAAAAQANIQAQQQARQAQQQAQYQQNYQNGAYQGQAGYGRMKTDRSLLMYILLTIVTCGISSWYFIYSIARDVNVLCAGDGQKTSGLLAFILLNLITCGIYSWFWYYSLGNRLAANAPRDGMYFQENGTTVLLWCLLGSFLCGIGPFVAMHILIKNTNALSAAYNQVNGL